MAEEFGISGSGLPSGLSPVFGFPRPGKMDNFHAALTLASQVYRVVISEPSLGNSAGIQQLAIRENGRRVAVMFINNGATDVFLCTERRAATTAGVKLTNGGNFVYFNYGTHGNMVMHAWFGGHALAGAYTIGVWELIVKDVR